MNLFDIKSVQRTWLEIFEGDGWTVEKIATAQIKDLMTYRGIGKITAKKVIKEAAALVNTQGLREAEKLESKRYYQKTPPWKIVEDWEVGGLGIKEVALSSIRAISILKGIDEDLASRCISAAQTKVNERGLYESRLVSPGGGATPKASSPAFPPEWLSGEVDPPPMGVRVKRAFDQAKKDYEAENE